jgi:hypothetical protein
MEGESDNPKPFQNKSSVSWVSPANPWRVCLPIFWTTKEATLQCCFRDCRKTLFLALFLSNFLHPFLIFQNSFTNDQKCGIS